MSDRPGTDPPREQEDHELDYLDSAVSESFDEDRANATVPIPDPPATGETSPLAGTGAAREMSRAVDEPAQGSRSIVADRSSMRYSTWTWPVINLVGLLVVIAVNYLANALEFNNQSTGDVVNQDPVPFQPAGWVFAIWGVIYALLLVLVLYGLTPGGRRNERLLRVSPYFLVANVANILWIVLWHWEQFAASMVTIVVLLIALLGMYFGLRVRVPFAQGQVKSQPSLMERIALRLPVSVYLGWIMVATLANLMVWLDRSGWDGGPLSYRLWAVVFMLAGTLVASAFAFIAREGMIALVMAVAFVGIAHHNWGDSALVSVAAIVLAVICVGLTGISWVLGYDRTNNRNPFGRPSGTPPPMTPVE